MTSKDFTNWLRGYIAGTNQIGEQVRDDITKILDSVNDDTTKPYTVTYRTGAIGVANTTADVRNDVTYNNDVPTTKTI
jgi:hypothetical protein